MSKIEITEQELHFMVFDLWMDKNIMNPINLGVVLKDKIKKHQAKHNEVLDIVSKSVFIVCENDDYGRDLYIDTKNTKEEAEELKGRITSRNIYEHEID